MTAGPSNPNDRAHPSVVRYSVIVPTYNRPSQLAACVAALVRLEPPHGSFEIVIVNDGGVTPPAELTHDSSRAGSSCVVRVLEQRNAGPASARNAGAAAARGEYLAFTDDDCLPEARWLVAFDATFQRMPNALLGGRTINAITSSVYAEASQQLADFVAKYFDGGVSGRFFTSNNIACARDAFFEVGAFDTSFPFSAGEDREFCDRWSAQGRPSASVEQAIVRHAHALTARRFLRQHFTYGRGARAFRRARTDAGRPVRVDPTFYARSIEHAISAGRGVRAPTFAALTVAAHGAYAAGLLWESLRQRSRPRTS